MNAQQILVLLAVAVFLFLAGLVAGATTERRLVSEHRQAKDCQSLSLFHPRLIHSEVRRG